MFGASSNYEFHRYIIFSKFHLGPNIPISELFSSIFNISFNFKGPYRADKGAATLQLCKSLNYTSNYIKIVLVIVKVKYVEHVFASSQDWAVEYVQCLGKIAHILLCLNKLPCWVKMLYKISGMDLSQIINYFSEIAFNKKKYKPEKEVSWKNS
jgi:hypothetical protein